MNSLPLHGNPEIRQLADRTNLDCDLKGDPKVEQFNPSSLASTEIAKLDRTSIMRPAPPPNSTSKVQPDTDRKERIPGLSSVSTRVDKTILNRHLTGDPNDGQSNPTHQPHTAIPLLPLDPKPRTTDTPNLSHPIALTLPNLDDMRGSVHSYPEDDSSSSQEEETGLASPPGCSVEDSSMASSNEITNDTASFQGSDTE